MTVRFTQPKVVMETKHTLRAYFLPYFTPSHSIPLAKIAQLFAARGVNVTIITTRYNSLHFQKYVDKAISLGHQISVQKLDFPFKEVGLPEGTESFSSATSFEIAGKIFRAFCMLQQPMEQFIREKKPDCLVADMHYFWASDVALDLAIPRLVYHVRSFFALCAADSISCHAPHKSIGSDEEFFEIPGLPDRIQMTRMQLPDWVRSPNGYTMLMQRIDESVAKSYGVLVESFLELEKDYANYYTNILGRKAWAIGPPPLCTKVDNDNCGHECLRWLDSQEPSSVLYLGFGSLSCFNSAQLLEIETALDSLNYPFIWVVRTENASKETKRSLEEFEEKNRKSNKGLIIRNWAPQVEILEHPAVGGFVTHCGWNSVVESVVAGVPMVAWPISAEQFYNEKLVTKVLRTGVEVGVETWTQMIEECRSFVAKDKIEKAVIELMSDSDEAKMRRSRANQISEAAKRAAAEGGSSYSNLTALLEELRRFPLVN